jgi:hypothetical protein
LLILHRNRRACGSFDLMESPRVEIRATTATILPTRASAAENARLLASLLLLSRP